MVQLNVINIELISNLLISKFDGSSGMSHPYLKNVLLETI